MISPPRGVEGAMSCNSLNSGLEFDESLDFALSLLADLRLSRFSFCLLVGRSGIINSDEPERSLLSNKSISSTAPKLLRL